MPDLPIQVPTVPAGFCATLGVDWVQDVINLMGQAVAKFEGVGTIVLDQATAPDSTQRSYLWRKTSDGRLYKWSSGAWISPHAYPANGAGGGGPRILYEGTTADLWSFDGGDGTDPSINAPATNNGAMWEIDTNYAGRSPMAVGDIASAYPAKTLAMSENFGEGAHTLATTELPPHSHQFTVGKWAADGNTDARDEGLYGNNDGTATPLNITLDTQYGSGTPPVALAHNTVHPVRGCWVIRRSARVNYVAS